jgi:hypothetical protein
MPSLRIAVPLLMLPLLSGPTFAGPPEGASGKMMMDKVEDGLRKYQQARTERHRAVLLEGLARIEDARVAVLLGETLADRQSDVATNAACLLLLNFIPTRELSREDTHLATARTWWKANEADLRRRAKQLPQ